MEIRVKGETSSGRKRRISKCFSVLGLFDLKFYRSRANVLAVSLHLAILYVPKTLFSFDGLQR